MRYAEDRPPEAPGGTNEIHGAIFADEHEPTGDESRQFANLEDAIGRAVVEHGGSC